MTEEGMGGEQQASTGPFPGRARAPSLAALGEHFPHLEILALLGQGGMGIVYKARQLKLDRLVALKILSPGPAAGKTFADRFLREARALARLNHPHIVSVHDFGEAGELYYFLMEFVAGGALRQLLRPGRLRQAEALSLLLQLCDALQYAHEEGVVHRDIKPENLLLDRRGRLKVADFGLAKLLGATPAAFTLTGSQQAMGTPHYMAPEQWEKAHTVDHRADIYSLGVVCYEMLTGELPLGRFALPSQKAPVDARLDEVVLRALEKDADRRYQQVAELRADVEAVAGGSHGPAPAVSPLPGTLPLGAMPAALEAPGLGTATLAAGTGESATGAGEAALRAARLQLKGPAAGLTFAGALSLAQPLLLQFALRGQPGAVAEFLLVGMTLVGMCFGVVTILAARKMWWLEAPEFAFIGSILAMVPLGVAWGVGLPMGIWALLVLRKPVVQAAFAAPKPPAQARQVAWGPGALYAFAATLLFVVLVVALFLAS
jgi:hypothetical protein